MAARNIANGDRVLLTMVGSAFNQTVLNTFLYRVSGVGTETPFPTALTDLYGVQSGAFKEDFLACLPPEYNLVAMQYQIIAPVRLRSIRFNVNEPGAGLNTATSANLQGSITRLGELADRRGVGGIRLMCAPDDIEAGVLKASVQTTYALFAAQMATVYDLAGGVGTFTPQVGVADPIESSQDMIAWRVQNTARVLRRRNVGQGI